MTDLEGNQIPGIPGLDANGNQIYSAPPATGSKILAWSIIGFAALIVIGLATIIIRSAFFKKDKK